VSAAYFGVGQVLELGIASLTAFRIVVAFGVLRILFRREGVANGINGVDRLLVLWAVWLVASSVFHASGSWVLRAGIVWSDLGCYLLFRVFVQDLEDVRRVFRVVCIILVPVAVLMFIEKYAGNNLFAALGGSSEIVVRNGIVRARGAFSHSILAGTVGATCFLMAIYLWKRNRIYALAGLSSGGGVVLTSASTGPVMMVLFGLFGLALWKLRRHMRAVRWLGLTAIIALDVIMKDPVYFLMARIDIAGGSTGWFRARLIQSSMEHLDEWWLAGTDYTRHWMSSGIPANEMHTDITNHVLAVGIMGGLPLMFLFIFILVVAFRAVGKGLREHQNDPAEHCLLIWTLGAILFAHVMNFLSISLFDQSIVFLYLIVAATGAIKAGRYPSRSEAASTGVAHRVNTRERPSTGLVIAGRRMPSHMRPTSSSESQSLVFRK
jgi:hypothetical protein